MVSSDRLNVGKKLEDGFIECKMFVMKNFVKINVFMYLRKRTSIT